MLKRINDKQSSPRDLQGRAHSYPLKIAIAIISLISKIRELNG